jgi:hypothetical protein
MLDSNQCRRNAEYYMQLSESAQAKKQKYMIKQLAVEWRRLSDLTERQEIHSAKQSNAARCAG